MINLFASPLYLRLSLILLVFFGIGFMSFPAHRKHMVFSGLLSIPFCFLEFAFIPEYWTPYQFSGFPVSPSDLLFSFSTGGIAWPIAAGFRDRPFQLIYKPSQFARRYVISSIVGVGFILCLRLLGIRIMVASLIGIFVGLMILMGVFKQKTPRLSRGAIGFGLFYVLVMKLSYFAWPDFKFQWRHESLWDFQPWEIPLEEILWAIGFGAVWPRFIAYVFGRERRSAE